MSAAIPPPACAEVATDQLTGLAGVVTTGLGDDDLPAAAE
jgi:hypothetical protein